MLPRSHRLTHAREFSRVVKSGRRSGSPLLVVHLAAADVADPGPRVGFVVSKAVGNAVVRNRVKRRLRHCVRERLGSIDPAVALVVRAQPAAAEASYAELLAGLDRCLERAQRPRHADAGRGPA